MPGSLFFSLRVCLTDYSLVVEHRLLIVVVSLIAGNGLQGAGLGLCLKLFPQ